MAATEAQPREVDVSRIKKKLEGDLVELQRRLCATREAVRNERVPAADEADVVHVNNTREMNVELGNGCLERLADAVNALRKIEEGAYGVCERCAADIPAARLHAMPAARFCVECQATLEVDSPRARARR